MKRVSFKWFFLPLLFLGWMIFAPPYAPFNWQAPQSNQFTARYPHLSYKIFFAVLEPWFEPQTQKTLLHVPEPPAGEPDRIVSAA